MLDDPDVLHEFVQSLTSHDPKTVKAYQSAMRGFIRWLREQPGGDPFSTDQITERVNLHIPPKRHISKDSLE